MYTGLELENKLFEDAYLKFYRMQECSPNDSHDPATRHRYLIYYCLSGKGTYQVNHNTYTIEAGDIFLIPPNIITYYKADATNPFLGHICGLVLMGPKHYSI